MLRGICDTTDDLSPPPTVATAGLSVPRSIGATTPLPTVPVPDRSPQPNKANAPPPPIVAAADASLPSNVATDDA